jgi:pyridoxal phosphate enzyme (YggS family)
VIADRVAAVRERIARAAARVGRTPGDITLVAISKTHPPESVREALAAGLHEFGENKVQEAEAKCAALRDLSLTWHLVGHLQGNKARKAAALFDVIHSVDSALLGQRLSRAAEELGRELRVLVQVNVAGEAAKSGLAEAELLAVLEALRPLPALRAVGLMTVPPVTEDPEQARPWFARLRALRDAALQQGLLQGSELSMGMSHDLEAAVAEGATLVRVGTAIFGSRG